jgi:hypothetical protein
MFHLFSFLQPSRVSWACKSDYPQERQMRDPTGYTQTSSGTCVEKRSRATCSDTIDPDYFRNELKAEKLQ